MHATFPLLAKTDFPSLLRDSLTTLQVNLGYTCNQTCLHCHVNAGPHRTETMDEKTVDLVLAVVRKRQIATLDLTGGAPELNAHFRRLVVAARQLGTRVIDRCNLTILSEPGQGDLAEFLAANGVEVVASMPCYSVERVDRQRGEGVFDKSIAGLQKLNALGYGKSDSELMLNLVYNPQGPALPPQQTALQVDYKRELALHFDVEFNQLFTLANMPIQRFGSTLVSKGQFQDYMRLLKGAFQNANLDTVMCKSMLSVDWQGYLFDCDFNQMLAMPARVGNVARPHLRDLVHNNAVPKAIRVADHCYGCTAGQGSSCSGALKAEHT